MLIDKKEIEKKVLDSLDELRPFFHADGGDMEFVEVQDDGTVLVRLLGSCSDCSMSSMTLKTGVEETIKKNCPQVKRVVGVNMPSTI